MTIDEKILSLESVVTPDSYTFNGEPIWPVLRLNIYLSENKSASKRVHWRKALIFFLSGLWDTIKGLVLPSRKADNILLTTSHYKVWENGLLFDKIIDPVLKYLEIRSELYQVWEFTSDYKFSRRLSYKKWMRPIQRQLYVKHRVKSVLKGSSGFRLEGDIKRLNKELSNLGLSFRINRGFIQKLGLIFDNAEYFKKELSKTGAKRVFVVCYYDAKGLAMVKAANELNIPVIDLQHGVQGDRHMAYAKWPQSLIKSKFLPSHFFVWNNPSFETIKEWKSDSSKILIGGNQWVLDRVRKVSNDIILVSLQPIPDFVPEEVLSQIREYQGEKMWYIRLHPSQLHQINYVERLIRDWHIAEKVNVREASMLPLTALLERSTLHVTFYSSVAIEASYYNVPTYFLSLEGATMYRTMIPLGLSYYYPETKLSQLLDTLERNSGGNIVNNSVDVSILDRFIHA